MAAGDQDAARDPLIVLHGQLIVALAARNADLKTPNAELETRVADLEERPMRLRHILSRAGLMLTLTRVMSRSPPATRTTSWPPTPDQARISYGLNRGRRPVLHDMRVMVITGFNDWSRRSSLSRGSLRGCAACS